MTTTKESIHEYLARGGTITRVPSSPPRRTDDTHDQQRPVRSKTHISWRRYLAQLIHDDALGAYCAFSLTTTASLDALTRIVSIRCLRATHLHNPEPRRRLTRDDLRSWSRSQLQHRGTLVFLLPATSASGHQHFHGFIRTPREYAQHLLPLTIYEHSERREVLIPQEVAVVFGAAKNDRFNNNALRNIHITNDGTRAVLLHENADAREHALNYWMKTSDGEVRDFDNAHAIPHLIRKALPNANTTQERRVA